MTLPVIRQSRRAVASIALVDAFVIALVNVLVIAFAGEAFGLPEPVVIAQVTSDFVPLRDGFEFGNGLRWDYDVDEVPLAGTDFGYDQRCSQMARAARQFFYAARFVPDQPPLSRDELRARIRSVMKSDPRARVRSEDPILFPGYSDLASFSAVHEDLVKDALGGRWRAYRQRGNWRMIFSFTPSQERRTAEGLLAALDRGHPPIVHVLRYPNVTINHMLLIHAATATTTEIAFEAYDPNDPGRPLPLLWNRAEARFELGKTAYWQGGVVNAYEIFNGWLN